MLWSLAPLETSKLGFARIPPNKAALLSRSGVPLILRDPYRRRKFVFTDRRLSQPSTRSSLTENFWVVPTSDLTQLRRKALLTAFYLATQATMTRPKKDDAAAAASPTAAKTTYKRKRKPGEERFYAVRAGRVPGVYLTWAECQAMTTNFAGASCLSASFLLSVVPSCEESS